ncbi:MAG TPA: regulatory iron-sulfur-containing complex subunit RicT [Bacteroidia bacterium]|nr:regulatory iron-sulfur-containing complex subunit RicT [Bacteroidia bacterium]
MACTGCVNGRGCSTLDSQSKGTCGNCSAGSCNKLNVFNWLGNISEILPEGMFPVVEVRFKNSRKEFYLNPNKLILYTGDVVVTEAETGYDVGTVSATGEIVRLQLRKKEITDTTQLKKILRKAKPQDIQKWKEAQVLEYKALIKSRELAQSLKLEMKLIDVEYQGDKTKATFYYTADGRVDFRELIKKLASELKARIEMRQIGARQEAARLGGIGVCGRELCCSTWLTDFRSVSTNNIRYQQLSVNPSKLAGQCGKLKCCLNYELDAYLDALKEFPEVQDKVLVTQKGQAKFIKIDVFRRRIYWAYENDLGTFIPLSIERTKDILEMNKNNVLPEDLLEPSEVEAKKEVEKELTPVTTESNLDRFNDKFKKNKKNFQNRKNK